jgi:hypothetical protein
MANRRWLDGIGVIFSPRFAPTLYLGAFRLFYKYLPVNGLRPRDVLALFQPLEKSALGPNAHITDAADQIASLTARWVFPQSGFEIYGEWARNDHSWDTRDFILQPDHATGRLLGLQKVFLGRDGFLRVGFESIALPAPELSSPREGPTWYIHQEIVEGYTQRGQIIGAAVGPAGSGTYLLVDEFRPWGRVGTALSVARDDDYRLSASDAIPTRPAITVSGTRIFRNFDIDCSIRYERQLNRYRIANNDRSNLSLSLRGVWAFGHNPRASILQIESVPSNVRVVDASPLRE